MTLDIKKVDISAERNLDFTEISCFDCFILKMQMFKDFWEKFIENCYNNGIYHGLAYNEETGSQTNIEEHSEIFWSFKKRHFLDKDWIPRNSMC